MLKLSAWVFALICALTTTTATTKIDVDVINETIRNLLHFRFTDHPNGTFPHRRTSHNLNEYMKDLYQIFNEEDGSDDGNVVRAIEPAVGKVNGEEVLVYDISNFDQHESIMRAELHFYLRRRDSYSHRRARQIRAKTICISEYCRSQSFRRVRQSARKASDHKVVFDATKSVFESYHLDTTQLVVKITRENTKMRPYVEMVRRSTPFLIVYSKVNHTIDTNNIMKQAEQAKRKRREIVTKSRVHAKEDRKYYTYASIPLDDDRRGNIRRRPISSSEESRDIWNGFGEETSKEELEKMEIEEMKNDVRVVLLQNRNSCHKQGTLISVKHFGWNKWIIEPESIETSFCKGKCVQPLTRASNHAQLQSILAENEPICCAPTNLKSLNILYRDENGRTVIRNYPKMIIGSCSCL